MYSMFTILLTILKANTSTAGFIITLTQATGKSQHWFCGT